MKSIHVSSFGEPCIDLLDMLLTSLLKEQINSITLVCLVHIFTPLSTTLLGPIIVDG